MAALLPAVAQADIIPPIGGGGRRLPPLPPPLVILKGAEILKKIHKAGFECPNVTDVVEEAEAGVDPARYRAENLQPYKVTCSNGKHFLVTLPIKSEDVGGKVVALD